MFTSEIAVVVDRSVEEVFAFVSDARNRPRWDESVGSEELTSAEPIGVGSTVRTRMTSMGRDYSIDWEIVEHNPPVGQRIESTSGPFSTMLVYDLAELGDGTFSQVLSHRSAHWVAAAHAAFDRAHDPAQSRQQLPAARSTCSRAAGSGDSASASSWPALIRISSFGSALTGSSCN